MRIGAGGEKVAEARAEGHGSAGDLTAAVRHLRGARVATAANAGAKGVFKTVPLAAHPGGTAKIGQVVDADLKSLKYDNLYVCDCSVIPEPWGLPPVFTIICLGKRLAKALAGAV